MPVNIDQANFNAVRVLQFENGGWTDKTAAAPPRDFAAKSVYAIVSTLDALTAASPNGPVTGTSAISARLITPGGRGVSSAIISARSASGSLSFAVANPFGYFRFKNLTRGENIVLAISSKRYEFAPQLISLNDDLTEIVFTSQ